MNITLAILLVIFGLICLWKGADWLVDGASTIAKMFGIPSIVIGLTVVAFGTSLPELIVSFLAALEGNSGIAFGNVLGSNIVNVFFILGLSAALASLPIKPNTVKIEIPLAILAAVLLFVFTPDGLISRSDAFILLACFAIFFIYTIKSAKSPRSPELKQTQSPAVKHQSLFKPLCFIALGLGLLVLGGNFTVSGASTVAAAAGLSQTLIGLTIVAIGTSLPELITSVVGVLKKETDIAVGNIVGSNIFNTFWILGISALISPIHLDQPTNLYFDLAANILTFALVLGFVLLFRSSPKKYTLLRWQGLILLLIYLCYAFVIINREIHLI